MYLKCYNYFLKIFLIFIKIFLENTNTTVNKLVNEKFIKDKIAGIFKLSIFVLKNLETNETNNVLRK
jgi:hypothetical protein